MPIYEYEKADGECLVCEGRFAVLQSLDDAPLAHCPWCGLKVVRVVSKASIVTSPKTTNAQRAADKGLTTWKRAGEGKWEKVAGDGVDAIVGDPADIKAVKQEKKKIVDLDKD